MGEIKFCPSCGSPVTPGDKFCTECGQRLGADPLPAVQTEYPAAGNRNNVNVTNVTVNLTPDYQPKSKWTAFFLCLFFGVLGAHRFYVGKIASGILYLCTGGLFGAGVLIDLLVILFNGWDDKRGYKLV